MNNLNFMSGKLKDNYLKVKEYKLRRIIFFLWTITIILYLTYFYLNNKAKSYEKSIQNRVEENYLALQNDKNRFPKKLNSLNTLEKIIKDPNINSINGQIVVNENKLDLNIIIKSEEEYYNILKKIEASGFYKILKLSTINSNENELYFKITLEVKA